MRSIVTDAVELVRFAADPGGWTALPPDAVTLAAPSAETDGTYLVTVTLPGSPAPSPLSAPVVLQPSVWSPAAYVPLLRAVAGRLRPAADQATLPDDEPLTTLTRPVPGELTAQNARISAWLTRHPADAAAHEQAALLLGVLGLRENSGSFWDPRELCNRATAHLAAGRALAPAEPTRGPGAGDDARTRTDAGAVAELLVGLLVDTKADCDRRIADLAARGERRPALAPWARAAAVRNTRDYRALAAAPTATLLERIEEFRARCEGAGERSALAQLGRRHAEMVSDWPRIVLQFPVSVGTGHGFTGLGLTQEWREIAQVFPGALGRAPDPEQLAAVLDREPAGPVVRGAADQPAVVSVLDPGTWGRFLQRHLLHVADRTHRFLESGWGVKPEAEELRKTTTRLFARLSLAPLYEAAVARTLDETATLSPAAVDLVRRRPEWVPSGFWAWLEPARPDQPSMAGWFAPALPRGTAYDFYGRKALLPGDAAERREALRRLYELAPWQYGVAAAYLQARSSDHPTDAQFQEVLGPLLEYYGPALRWYARLHVDDPPRYGEIMRRIAQEDPTEYLALGAYYRRHDLTDQAVAAYEAAVEKQADPVGVANDCGWLVDYYYDHGKQDRAVALATMAADVYSSRGLETMARLMERMGKLDRAEEHFQKIVDRYQNHLPLLLFYRRHVGEDAVPDGAEKLARQVKTLFPGGLEEVTLARFTAPPTRGVLVTGHSELSDRSGLRDQAIIVALDGKRTENFEQYAYVGTLRQTPEVEVIAYQEGRYQVIRAKLPGRQFGVGMHTWKSAR